MNRSARAVALCMLSAALAGCVSTGKYRQEVKRADTLSGEKKTLEEGLATSRGENEKLLSALEANKDELSRTVADLTRQNQELSQNAQEIQQAKEAEIARLKGTYDQLVSGMKEEITAGQIKITQLAGKLSVNLVDKIIFESGSADVKPQGRKVLERVAAILKKVNDKDIRIEGHTDDIPIGSALKEKFPSNWELSTARATAVARYLKERGGIEPQRLIAAGYGEFRPIAPNDTEESRTQNRRIEIVLVAQEPGTASATAPAKPIQTSGK